jgi:branched-chain amino acid aminotransferase
MLDIAYNLLPDSERRKEPFVPNETLPFGKLTSQHVFLMDHDHGEWQNPRIVPYNFGLKHLDLPFGISVLPYGAGIFEGAKAFEHKNGELYTFRLDENVERLNKSADILCMPEIPEDFQLEGINALLDVDRLCYPQQDGACIYIRPQMFEIDDKRKLGVGEKYIFLVMLSPSGPYYPQGFDTGTLLIQDRFHRAAPGGTGQAKCGGNYAAARRAGKFAKRLGAQQVLYLDVFNKEIEEAGAMNHYHVTKGGTIVIPEFTDTILESITSRSIISLENRLELPIAQMRIPITEFIDYILSGDIVEAGGLGTAAAVAPIGEYLVDLNNKDLTHKKIDVEHLGNLRVADGKVGPVSKKMYDLLTGIQTGRYEAPEGWVKKVERK